MADDIGLAMYDITRWRRNIFEKHSRLYILFVIRRENSKKKRVELPAVDLLLLFIFKDL